MASLSGHKQSAADFALLGGTPLFSAPLHVGAPIIGNRDVLLARINDVLDRRWFTNDGPLVRELELRIGAILDVQHCVAVSSGTLALQLVIRALALAGEVLMPSFTFVGTAHALEWQRVKPVFGDIDPSSHSLDPALIESMITARTTGIIGVHLWGEPCAVEQLTAIAKHWHLKLIFDASHAFGCSHSGRMIGSFGDAEVFSFHATKYFNTLEGGAVTTNDAELAAKVRLLRNFGFAGYDKVVSAGTNAKMNEIAAAMGLTGLESLDQFKEVNRHNYECYQRNLSGVPGVRIYPVCESEERNFQYVVIEWDAQNGISRDLIVDLLHAENVIARRYFHPGCHRMEPYLSSCGVAGFPLPFTEALCDRVIVLPTGTSVNATQIEGVCSLLRSAQALAPDLLHLIRHSGRSTCQEAQTIECRLEPASTLELNQPRFPRHP
ncbi:MAG: DegT/DnrJ/EryC1/StrS family aminotransferase [Bryobacteraceae bacterium]